MTACDTGDQERGCSGYMAVVRGLLDALAIQPGKSVLEVGCGSGVITRELARRTAGANRPVGRDDAISFGNLRRAPTALS